MLLGRVVVKIAPARRGDLYRVPEATLCSGDVDGYWRPLKNPVDRVTDWSRYYSGAAQAFPPPSRPPARVP